MSIKPPKEWTTWFFSDPHFGHKAVIDFCDRPFKDIEEMNETIIKNWNKLVRPEDLCIFVGDVFFYYSKNEAKKLLSRMNGRKILVRGNHDTKPRAMMNIGFEICVEQMEMLIANERVTISHFPFRWSKYKHNWHTFKNRIRNIFSKRKRSADKLYSKRPENKGQFLIHGHTHSKEKVNGKMIHVGVDAWNFRPVNIQEISNIIDKIRKSEKQK